MRRISGRAARRATAWVLAVVAMTVMVGSTAGAGGAAPSSVTIRKVVVGPAAEGSSLRLDCTSPEVDAVPVVINFTFDATGAPIAADAFQNAIAIQDGAFFLSGNSNVIRSCTFTETGTGGAASTSWTCDYTRDPPADAGTVGSAATAFGCSAAAGDGTGPISLTFGTPSDDIKTQSASIVFTNTYAVELDPAFTG